ncbi:uncharacterized protein LOC119172023 [Rhipicephalus microplus]|uniref:uncharacterized protein LOC119172023 n=1 Tax=Rhipicephalus microplus TaxID=6941 RepID=UPI003F6B6579
MRDLLCDLLDLCHCLRVSRRPAAVPATAALQSNFVPSKQGLSVTARRHVADYYRWFFASSRTTKFSCREVEAHFFPIALKSCGPPKERVPVAGILLVDRKEAAVGCGTVTVGQTAERSRVSWRFSCTCWCAWAQKTCHDAWNV